MFPPSYGGAAIENLGAFHSESHKARMLTLYHQICDSEILVYPSIIDSAVYMSALILSWDYSYECRGTGSYLKLIIINGKGSRTGEEKKKFIWQSQVRPAGFAYHQHNLACTQAVFSWYVRADKLSLTEFWEQDYLLHIDIVWLIVLQRDYTGSLLARTVSRRIFQSVLQDLIYILTWVLCELYGP